MIASDQLLTFYESTNLNSACNLAASYLIPAFKNPAIVFINAMVETKSKLLFKFYINFKLVNRLDGGLYSLSELVPGNGCMANLQYPLKFTHPPLSFFSVEKPQTLHPPLASGQLF